MASSSSEPKQNGAAYDKMSSEEVESGPNEFQKYNENVVAESSICQNEDIKKTLSNFDVDHLIESILSLLRLYISKFCGVKGKSRPKRLPISEMLYTFPLSFMGILLISVTDNFYLNRVFMFSYEERQYPVRMLTGAFAATAVLVYALHTAPASQPRNVIIGHVSSAIIGVSVRLLSELIGTEVYLQAAISVCTAILVMDILECIHPPGGATALIAIIGGGPVYSLGYGYVLTCLGGAIISVAFGCIGSNLIRSRQYPQYWW